LYVPYLDASNKSDQHSSPARVPAPIKNIMQDGLVLHFGVGLLVYYADVVRWAIPTYWKVYQFWKLVHNNTNNNNNNDDHQLPPSIFDDVEMSDTLQQQQQQQIHTEYIQWNDETPFMPHTTIATSPTSARKVEL
jgi:hypothetical protein